MTLKEIQAGAMGGQWAAVFNDPKIDLSIKALLLSFADLPPASQLAVAKVLEREAAPGAANTEDGKNGTGHTSIVVGEEGVCQAWTPKN